jgi:hypothetical protein
MVLATLWVIRVALLVAVAAFLARLMQPRAPVRRHMPTAWKPRRGRLRGQGMAPDAVEANDTGGVLGGS